MPSTTDYVAAVVVSVEPESLIKLQKVFKKVHYHPNGNIPVDAAKEAQLWLTSNKAIPANVAPIAELPNLRHIQLVSAGAEKALPTAHMEAYAKGGETDRVTVSTAAGLHVVSIPNYVVAMVVNIYAQIPQQIIAGRVGREISSRTRLTDSQPGLGWMDQMSSCPLTRSTRTEGPVAERLDFW